MADKEFNVRVRSKHDTQANWELAPDFVPLEGEIIVYDVDDNYNHPRMKIGDGRTRIGDLPFVEQEIKTATEDEILDMLITIDALPALTDEDGAVFVTETDSILLI